MKQVSNSLKLELAQYHEMESFAKFGSDLDAATTEVLNHGERLTKLLVQNQYAPMRVSEQVLALFSAKYKYLKAVPVDKVQEYEKGMIDFVNREYPYVLDRIETEQKLSDDLTQEIKKALDAYAKQFAVTEGAIHGTK